MIPKDPFRDPNASLQAFSASATWCVREGKGRERKGIREKEVKERSDAEIKDNNKRN